MLSLPFFGLRTGIDLFPGLSQAGGPAPCAREVCSRHPFFAYTGWAITWSGVMPYGSLPMGGLPTLPGSGIAISPLVLLKGKLPGSRQIEEL